MAATIQSTDSIDSSGLPLCFKVRAGKARSRILSLEDSQDVIRVEARAMGGHQKEAVATEGASGPAWRMVSDEGAGLKGTDLAPFPLGFMSAGIQADLLNRITRLAAARDIDLSGLESHLINDYAFEGSFFRGDGQGFAYRPRLLVRAGSSRDDLTVRGLIDEAIAGSPTLSAWRTPLVNTFALYANGRRIPFTELASSTAGDAADPLKSWRDTPRPVQGEAPPPHPLIEKMGQAPATNTPSPLDWQSGRVDIPVQGTTVHDRGTTRSLTWLARPGGTVFSIRSDERVETETAPSGLALAYSGIAFCLMTQLLRYVEHHRMNVRALRLVQFAPCEIANGRAIAHPLDTHVFVHGNEPDDVIERLLGMAARTCYLHAALHAAIEPIVTLELNGQSVPAANR